MLEHICIPDCHDESYSIRTDSKTGRRYNYFNIPVSENVMPLIRSKKGLFRIVNYNFRNPSLSWSGERFTGDRYAVFQYNSDTCLYNQVSEWYSRYTYAEQKLKDVAGLNRG